MLSQSSKIYKLTLKGLLVAAAMVLSWVEMQIPVFTAVPGMKLGLTNLVVLTALYYLGEKDAVILNVLRIFLAGATFGNLFSVVYSLAGGLLSGLIMILLKKSGRFGITSVSMAGGIFHNVGQILIAMAVLETKAVLYYLPVLWAAGVASGAVIGLIGAQVLKRLSEYKRVQLGG